MKRLLWATALVLAITSLAGCVEASGSSQSGSSNCLLFCGGGSSQEASFHIDMGPFFVTLLVFFAVIAIMITIAVAASRSRASQQQQQQVVVHVNHDSEDATRR